MAGIILPASFMPIKFYMSNFIIPAALVVTLIITFILSAISKRPLRGLWIVFILLFLTTWSGQLWIAPIGPRLGGVAWIPLAGMALLFLFFLLAIIPKAPRVDSEGKEVDGPLVALGIFFWIIIVLLIFSIAVGYYKPGYQIG
jgi:hypothetical protein